MTTTLLRKDSAAAEVPGSGSLLHVCRLSGDAQVVIEQDGLTVQHYLTAAGITLGQGETVSLNGSAVELDTVVPPSQGATNLITISDEIANG